MTGWNHRVVRKHYMGETVLGIHEVYYDDEGVPEMVTVEPVGAVGDTLVELKEEFLSMLAALKLPILEYDDIGKAGDV